MIIKIIILNNNNHDIIDIMNKVIGIMKYW